MSTEFRSELFNSNAGDGAPRKALPVRGRLPKAVECELNEAWVAAGNAIPNEYVLASLITQLGDINQPRLMRFFTAKARRTRHQRKNGNIGASGSTLDEQRL